MRLKIFAALFCASTALFSKPTEKNTLCYKYPIITASKDWTLITTGFTSKHIQYALIDKKHNRKGICPSINLSTEKVGITLAQYIQEIKKIYSNQRTNRIRDLGPYQIDDLAGHLVELDMKGKWGVARMLQFICIDNTTAYIITATAKADSFNQYAGSFKDIISSFDLHADPFDKVSNLEDRHLLRKYLTHISINHKEGELNLTKDEIKSGRILLRDLGEVWERAAIAYLTPPY